MGAKLIFLDIGSIESLQSSLDESSRVIQQTVSKKNEEINELIASYNFLLAVRFIEMF